MCVLIDELYYLHTKFFYFESWDKYYAINTQIVCWVKQEKTSVHICLVI